MEHIKRERAAWRFDPRILKRLREFVAQQERQITQTTVIELAICDYIERNSREASKRAARR